MTGLPELTAGIPACQRPPPPPHLSDETPASPPCPWELSTFLLAGAIFFVYLMLPFFGFPRAFPFWNTLCQQMLLLFPVFNLAVKWSWSETTEVGPAASQWRGGRRGSGGPVPAPLPRTACPAPPRLRGVS